MPGQQAGIGPLAASTAQGPWAVGVDALALPCCAAAAKAEEEEEEEAAAAGDVTTVAPCSDFTAVSKLPPIHCPDNGSRYDTGCASGRNCQCQPP